MLHYTSTFDAEAGARLIEQVGTPAFADALLAAAKGLNDVEELFGYLVVDGQEPQTIVTASFLADADKRVGVYVDRFFRHDPAVREFLGVPPGRSFAMRITQQGIAAPDYRRLCFSGPGFAEKLSFGWRGGDYLLVLSFYCRAPSDETAIAALEPLVALVMPVMVHHHRPIASEQALVVIERRLRRSFPALSQRELEVCARTMLGESARETASALGIGEGSVLTYRRRAYDKAGMSSAGEFVAAVLR